MKKRYFYVAILIAFLPTLAFSQVSGTVYEYNEHKQLNPLPGVNIYWQDTKVATVTNIDGEFSMKTPEGAHYLVVSFVGYQNDTLHLHGKQDDLKIVLSKAEMIDEVVIKRSLGSAYISSLKPMKTEVITQHGLQKLACCNLAESFENNATIDVGFADAISGVRQIKMLGLSGKYSQLMIENVPAIRGLSSSLGLNFIPGPWMQSIQISKGTAAVNNGYESMTGQINMELKKPDDSEKLFVNLFGNTEGRAEANINTSIQLNHHVQTAVLAHASTFRNRMDRNNDGFLDKPLSTQYNFVNRWNFHSEHLHAQLFLNYLEEKREGGQMSFFDEPENDAMYYGLGINTHRFYGFSKIGYGFHRPATSLALMASYTQYMQESFYGNTQYDAAQNSVYLNLVFQSYMGTTAHKYTIGLDYNNDRYDEALNERNFLRNESVPAVYGQYTYELPDKLTMILGLRTDFNSVYGTLVTPRLHVKYDFGHHHVVRASAGKGYRSANVISENSGLLASSRNLIFEEEFDIEHAWNYGINYSKKFHLGEEKEGTITFDLYRTDFVNQVIADLDQSAREVHFYNLDGTSYSNNFQFDLTMEAFKGFDLTLAYRYSDVKANLNGELQEVPLVNKYKGLITLSYATENNRWQFDVTGQLNGRARLPYDLDHPVEYQWDDYSPVYPMFYAQLTKRFTLFDVYLGVENLLNYTQEEPIIDAQNPFGDHFDASMVWGPVLGRMFYAGMRFTLD